MKRWLLHIWLMSVLGILAASCSQVIDDPISGPCGEEIEADNVTIQFTLDLGELDGRTSRSSWEGYDGDGTSDSENAILGDYVYENYIDVNTLEVIVLGTDGTYKGYVDIDPTKIVRDPENTNNGRRYTFEGRLEVPKEFISNQTLNCKLMVIANSGSVLTEDSNGNITFNPEKLFDYDPENFHANATATTKKYIPMWGIATYTGVWLPYGIIQKLDTPIYMLRSMAKIEVTMKDELYDQGYRIMGATLNKYLSQGLVMPKTITTNSTDVLTTQVDVFNPVIVPSTNPVTGTWGTSNFKDYDSTITDEPKYKTWVIYVPEMNNQDNSLKVLLNLGKTNGTTTSSITTTDALKAKHVVELKDYEYKKPENDNTAPEIKPYDIVRNWYYKYTITHIEDGFNLTVQAMPWTLQPISMSFNDIVTYNVTGWIQGTYNDIDNDDHLLYMTQSKNAEFIFDIVTPEDCEYQIGLTNNLDFSLTTETQIDGSIKVIIQALDTTAERPKTALYVYAKDKYGRNVELDLTGTGTGNQSTEDQESVNRYTIIQNW